ncbi:MAG: TetR/AcrR family transcriptional regulator [Acidimicrobiales bacterium]
MNSKRRYQSAVRDERAAATRERIVSAAQSLFADASQDFTVERVASMAGVSVQTALRAFGSRAGLIHAAIGTLRAEHGPEQIEHVHIEPFGSTAAAVTALFDDYESIGDRVVRMLAEEHRVADLGEMAAIGRRMHRQWVEAAFATRLPTRRGRARDEVLTSLLTATDVYVWKLLRRDFGLGRAAAERVVVRLAEGVLPNSEER